MIVQILFVGICNCFRNAQVIRYVELRLTDISTHHVIGSESAILVNGDIMPALFTRILAVIPFSFIVEKISSTASREVKSAGTAYLIRSLLALPSQSAF